MLPEPAYVLSPRPVRDNLLVFDVYQLGCSDLYVVSLKRGSRYDSRYERFTCCKSIAAIYYRIYEEQKAAQRRERSLLNRMTDPDDIGAVDLEGLEVAYIIKITAIGFVAAIVLFALFMWLKAIVPPLFFNL